MPADLPRPARTGGPLMPPLMPPQPAWKQEARSDAPEAETRLPKRRLPSKAPEPEPKEEKS